MSEGINLLEPNKNTGSGILLARLHKMRIFTVGLLFIISVSSVVLFILVALSPLPALQRQEQFLRQTLSASKSSIVTLSLVNSQTDAIDRIITQRKTFDKPISLIQDKLSGDITVQQMQIDEDGVVVTVESSSLQSLDTFVSGMVNYVQSKNTFSKATLVDLTKDQTDNQYALTIQLNYL